MKYMKYLIPITLFVLLTTFGISKYDEKRKAKLTYHTIHESKDSTMIIGGMAENKEKIETFKESLKEQDFRGYWDNLKLSAEQEKAENLLEAIALRKKALSYAKTKGDVFQVYWGLARLYEKNKQYGLAIEQLRKVIEVNSREDVKKDAKERIARLESLNK
ncbi:MAG: hypothetical protein KJ995_08185 [Candidatus Omnitrophica bacterium]|nr:hypothetical protein [Candidatus Omnitrophota bacterium]MBU1852365.1 hypothetical protein [Candidatus Omnitrophota bacterium]